MKTPKANTDPILLRFQIESDARLFQFLGLSALLGVGFISYALTVDFAIRQRPGPGPDRFARPEPEDRPVAFVVPEKKPARQPPRTAKYDAPPGKAKGKGVPNAEATKAWRKEISSLSEQTSALASDVFKSVTSALNRDIGKVMDRAAGFTRTQTRLGDQRPGMPKTDYTGYIDGKPEGPGGLIEDLWSPPGGKGVPRLKTGEVPQILRNSEVGLGWEEGRRSDESIMLVVRQYIRGLRHAYNKYLKLHPGMGGKVAVRFLIAPGGSVVEISVVSSTTGVPDFDREILEKIKAWRFEPVKGGAAETVTVPFTFSE